jgi:hypothetical protein
VWVLVGGDGSQRQRAFRSGANVAAKLARCCDIQVCLVLSCASRPAQVLGAHA